jgi:transposase
MKTNVNEHTISSHWCPRCKESKEETITDALPGFTIGNNALVFSAILHFTQGVSLKNIVKDLGIMQLNLTTGCLVNAWHKLAEILTPYYEEIKTEIKKADAVYADETGWREFGKRFWMWGFFTLTAALYVIRPKRNKSVVLEILGEVFNGILITDFWKPYLAVTARLRQWCIAHYMREFIKIEDRRSDLSKSYFKFRRAVRRLFTEALNFNRIKRLSKKQRNKRKLQFLKRLDTIIAIKSNDVDVIRLQKRLKTYREGLFTFIVESVDPTNNFSERMIRFAVILRKVRFHTMSAKGSHTLSVLLTVFKTMQLRGLDPYKETLKILQNHISNKKIDKLPLAA